MSKLDTGVYIEHKLLELPITTALPLQVAVDKEAYVNNYLANKIVGKCFDGVFVIAVNKVIDITGLTINLGLRASATLGVKADLRAYICPKKTILVGMRCIANEKTGAIAKLQDDMHDTSAIQTNIDQTLIMAMRPGQFLPIRVENVSYIPYRNRVNISSYSLYLPMLITIRVSITDITAAKVKFVSSWPAFLERYKSVVDSLAEYGEHTRVVCDRLYGKHTVAMGGQGPHTIELSGMGSISDVFTAISNGAFTCMFPQSDDIRQIKLSPYKGSANVYSTNDIDIILTVLYNNITTLASFVKHFNTMELVDSHTALWKYYMVVAGRSPHTPLPRG